MKKYYFLIILIIFSNFKTLSGQDNGFEKFFALNFAGFYTPIERTNLKPANFNHQASLFPSRSFGFQIDFSQNKTIGPSKNWSRTVGVLYGFYPHATRLFIPISENIVNWETNNVITDLDEYFGIFLGISRNIILKKRLVLKPTVRLLVIKQIKLGYNTEEVLAIDNNFHTFLLYAASIKTPPNHGFSFLPEIKIEIERRFYKNLSYSFSFFQNFGSRLSHSGQFIICTNQGEIEGNFTKKFYFGGIKLGLNYHR